MRVRLGFKNCFAVNKKGKSGEMALLWNMDVEVSFLSFSDNHIDVNVKAMEEFRLTLFYGKPRVDMRRESWNLLNTLAKTNHGLWMVYGDFNEILFSWEMKGNRSRDENQMRGFREVLKSRNLFDIGCSGDIFTFSNRRKGSLETKVTLDRVVSNGEWRMLFPHASVRNGFANTSDHKPIILYLKERMTRNIARKAFRFESMWIRDNNFQQVVENAWNMTNMSESGLTEKLKICSDHINSWNVNVFGNVRKKIRDLKHELAAIKNEFRSEDNIAKEKLLSDQLDEWFAREELLWKQRSRATWLRDGDKNTVFFKTKATQRRKKKFIEHLETDDGNIIMEPQSILNEFFQYFTSLFSTSKVTSSRDWEDAMRYAQPKVRGYECYAVRTSHYRGNQ